MCTRRFTNGWQYLSMHHKSVKEESRMARRMRVSYAYSLLNNAGPSIDELGTVPHDF
jgi:hypothetical protein